MHLLRVAVLLFVPVLLHAGFLNIQLSATCNTTTVSASSGSVSCATGDGGSAQAQSSFGNTGAAIAASALASFDTAQRFSATASLEAEYQITFFGGSGPGLMEATLCVGHDTLGSGSAFLIAPNGSISLPPDQSSCRPPSDIPIVFGVPLDVRLSFQAQSGLPRCCGVGGSGGAGVSLTYQALDATMTRVPFTVEVVVPEPSTLPLCMFGACLLPLAAAITRNAAARLRSLGPLPSRR